MSLRLNVAQGQDLILVGVGGQGALQFEELGGIHCAARAPPSSAGMPPPAIAPVPDAGSAALSRISFTACAKGER